MITTRVWVKSLLVLMVLGSTLAAAQTGDISGKVVDRVTREPLPSANVLLIGTALGASTDVDGRFEVRGVPYATYQVRVTLVGYEPVVLSDVVLSSGRLVELTVELDQAAIGIEGVEVTASYFRKTPDAVTSIQRLGYEEIRRSPGGFEDVVRAISVFPGVAVATAGRNDLVVRGGAPSENLYVLDNVEIPNINHYGTQGSGGGPLSYINLDFVNETAFSTGGFGVRYGDRLSSMLEIDLRNGRSDALGGKATISATQFGLDVEGPVTEEGSFILSARRSYLDFIFKAAKFSFIPQYWDFLGRLSYDFDQSNSLTFLGVGALDDVELNNETADDRYNNSQILVNETNQYASGISWRHLFSKGFVTTTLGRTFTAFNQVQRDSLLNPIFLNQTDEGQTSLRVDLLTKIGSVTELSIGAQVKNVRLVGGLVLPPYGTSFGDTVASASVGLDERGTKTDLYAQLHGHLLEGLQYTVGGRLDYFDLLKDGLVVAPRASLSYALGTLTTVNASAGVYYQAPSYIWISSNSANRQLRQAQATQYVLGIEQMLRSDFKVRVEGFLKRYRDYAASTERTYLIMANTGAGYGGGEEDFAAFGLDTLASAGTGRSYGLELLLQKKLSDIPFYGIVSLTLSNTRFTALDGVERTGSYDQPVILTVSGGWKIDPHWEVSMKFRYATGRPTTPYNPDGSQDVAQINTERLESLHGLDLRVDRRWNFTGWGLIAYLDLQNVYNNKSGGPVVWNEREQKAEVTWVEDDSFHFRYANGNGRAVWRKRSAD